MGPLADWAVFARRFRNPRRTRAGVSRPSGARRSRGGAVADQGFGLALMVDVLTGVLSGGGVALDPAPFGPADGVRAALLERPRLGDRCQHRPTIPSISALAAALADPDPAVRDQAVREAAEIVQAAYREVAGG